MSDEINPVPFKVIGTRKVKYRQPKPLQPRGLQDYIDHHLTHSEASAILGARAGDTVQIKGQAYRVR